MSSLLSQFLEALLPTLPAGLQTTETEERMLRLAAAMAPIPNVALEIHSLTGQSAIDLQQRVRLAHGEAQTLLDYIRPRSEGAWTGLRRFCEAWLDPATSLGAAIPEIYLEYDLQGETLAELPAVPSLFLVLNPCGDAARLLQASRDALNLLAPPTSAAELLEGIERGFAACPHRASVGAVGVMLGRSLPAVRINLKRVRLEALSPLLEDLRWKGPLSACERWAEWAFERVDRVTLALDIGRETWPHLGLECILLHQPAREPRWQSLLGELADRGLCSPEMALSMLRLPGIVAPTETSQWPASWIAASLLRPQDCFSTIERRLFYVKLTVAGQEQVAAKVYAGAGHVWRQANGDLAPEELPCAAAPVVRRMPLPSPAQLASSAAEFLLEHQEHTGRWWDFELPAGTSDEWVTAFVGTQLAAMPEGRNAANLAWAALLRRRSESEGWGYNRLTPADADSTAWALRLAARLGMSSAPRAQAAGQFLRAHALPGGGVTTYSERESIRTYTRLPAGASMAGWQTAHLCVTAAAAPFMGEGTLDFLRQTPETHGHWRGYWWWDDEYTSALVVDSLRASPHPEDAAAVRRACIWAAGRIGPDGAVISPGFGPSPFATAWAVHLLAGDATCHSRDAAQRAIAWLAKSQLADGSWAASARLRVPMPAETNPDESRLCMDVVDGRRLFTTASVLAALQQYEKPGTLQEGGQ